MQRKYDVIMLDIDGTIADRDSTELYPHVEHWLVDLPADQRIEFITNQGGPACHDAGWPSSDKFPTLATVIARLGALMHQVAQLHPFFGIYVSWSYQDKSGRLYWPKLITPGFQMNVDYAGVRVFSLDEAINCRLDPAWRKPEPGMVKQVLDHGFHTPWQSLVIGDRPEDIQAAILAGCRFAFASNEAKGFTLQAGVTLPNDPYLDMVGVFDWAGGDQ